MKSRIFLLSVLSLAIVLLVAACGTTRNSTRKCDGRKGQKTPMGLI